MRVCALSEVIAPGLVRRALADGGHDVATAGPTEWRGVLPHLEKRMRAYLSEGEAAARCRRVEALLAELAPSGDPLLPVSTPPVADTPRLSTPNPDA
jgi:hypothetical protein